MSEILYIGMEREEKDVTADCGCFLERDGTDGVRLFHCAMHDMAPEMVKALRQILDAEPMRTDSFVCDFDTLQSIAGRALRQLAKKMSPL